jgi:molybdate transport system substrate-binding protein
VKRVVFAALAVVGVVGMLAGCASPSTNSGNEMNSGNGPGATPVVEQTLTVFAAASLKDTFARLASDFESAHPGVTVSLNFAGSADLVSQITEGAPADVVAFADEKNMAKLTDAKLVDGPPQLFASNTLEIVVPRGNPAGITSFRDLARPGAKVVVCAAQVPCGSAATKIEEATGIALSPVSEESAVTDVLGKVSSGEADAGLVYVTDVEAAGDAVEGIAFPEASGAVNRYPIGVVAASARPELAAEFADLVTGIEGQETLQTAGFGKP